jgi:protein-disulfide isomerase
LIIAASNVIVSPNFSLKSSGLGKLTPSSSPVAAAAGQAVPTPTPKVDVVLGHLPPLGDANAKVAVVEFADYRCPFCEQFFTQTENRVMSDYVKNGKVKFAFRNFAFLGPASTTASNAAECANEQGKFWEYHDWLYKNQPPETDTSLYTSDKLASASATLGMNSSQFKQCVDATKYSTQVNTDMSDGQTAGVSGTPSFVIGKLDGSGTKIVQGTLIVGAVPYDNFKQAIDPLLK